MSTTRYRTAAIIGMAVLAPLLSNGVAFADPPPPVHVGDPALWGPAAGLLYCGNPTAAQNAGYNVILGNNLPEVLVGGPAADAIYGYGGNDTLYGAAGDDIICGGFGIDKIRGQQGNDALFGEAADDVVHGDKGRDFLDGGSQTDDCQGGDALDAAANCEGVLVSIP